MIASIPVVKSPSVPGVVPSIADPHVEFNSKKRRLLKRVSVVLDTDILFFEHTGFQPHVYSNRYPDHDANPCLESTLFFSPYLVILFDFLIANNCVIIFFGVNFGQRDYLSMANFLIGKYGKEKYDYLVQQGQFQVYSQQHLKKGVKSLPNLLRDDQTCDDIILVDSSPLHSVDQQREMICIDYDLQPNAVYFLLGLFRSYFDSLNTMTIRNFIGGLVNDWNADLKNDKWNYKDSDIEIQFIANGLLEIRKSVPDAVYHVPRDQTTYPIELMPSYKYVCKVLYELITGDRDAREPNMILFQRQFHDFFAPHIMSTVEQDDLPVNIHMQKSFKTGIVQFV